MHVNDVLIANPARPPHVADQLSAAVDAAGVRAEDVEDVELGSGEIDWLASEAHLAGLRIDTQGTECSQ